MSESLFLNLLRVLIPRWNFFDQVGSHFELGFRTSSEDEWHRLSFIQQRRWTALFSNADVNLALLEAGLLEQFAMDLQNLEGEETNSKGEARVRAEDVRRLTSYRLVRDLLWAKLRQRDFYQNATTLQFKLVACEDVAPVDVYISDWVTAVNL